MRVGKTIGVLSLLALIGIFGKGCGGADVRESETFVSAYAHPRVIALVPFWTIQPERLDQRLVRAPGFEGYISVGEIASGGPEIIPRLFRERLAEMGHTLVSEKQVVPHIPSGVDPRKQPEVYAQRLGRMVGADSVLMGWLVRYRERIGNALGVQQPASVAFVALLFRSEDGRLIWRGRFDETQKPLSEDVRQFSTFLRRGGTWVTASELASDGVRQVLLNFPGRMSVELYR